MNISTGKINKQDISIKINQKSPDTLLDKIKSNEFKQLFSKEKKNSSASYQFENNLKQKGEMIEKFVDNNLILKDKNDSFLDDKKEKLKEFKKNNDVGELLVSQQSILIPLVLIEKSIETIKNNSFIEQSLSELIERHVQHLLLNAAVKGRHDGQIKLTLNQQLLSGTEIILTRLSHGWCLKAMTPNNETSEIIRRAGEKLALRFIHKSLGMIKIEINEQ
jgi:hypothetical protein